MLLKHNEWGEKITVSKMYKGPLGVNPTTKDLPVDVHENSEGHHQGFGMGLYLSKTDRFQ